VEAQWSEPSEAHAPPPGRARYPLTGLANALTATLLIEAVGWLASLVWPTDGPVTLAAFVPSAILFLVWFRRARINADSSDWHQRRAIGWAVGGWFVPLASAWIPFQVMADIWRAGLPADRRSRRAVLLGFWWLCWLLSLTIKSAPRQVTAHPAIYVSMDIPSGVAGRSVRCCSS